MLSREYTCWRAPTKKCMVGVMEMVLDGNKEGVKIIIMLNTYK